LIKLIKTLFNPSNYKSNLTNLIDLITSMEFLSDLSNLTNLIDLITSMEFLSDLSNLIT